MRRRNSAGKRLSRLAHNTLSLFRERPGLALSYDALAERLDIDRSTAIRVTKRLVRTNRIVVVRGSGTRPNCYYPTDKLLRID